MEVEDKGLQPLVWLINRVSEIGTLLPARSSLYTVYPTPETRHPTPDYGCALGVLCYTGAEASFLNQGGDLRWLRLCSPQRP
jgi:hypothetical protein